MDPSPIPRIHADIGTWLQQIVLHTPLPQIFDAVQRNNRAQAIGASQSPVAVPIYWVGLFDAKTVTGVSR
jgi:hypothetical protein